MPGCSSRGAGNRTECESRIGAGAAQEAGAARCALKGGGRFQLRRELAWAGNVHGGFPMCMNGCLFVHVCEQWDDMI